MSSCRGESAALLHSCFAREGPAQGQGNPGAGSRAGNLRGRLKGRESPGPTQGQGNSGAGSRAGNLRGRLKGRETPGPAQVLAQVPCGQAELCCEAIYGLSKSRTQAELCCEAADGRGTPASSAKGLRGPRGCAPLDTVGGDSVACPTPPPTLTPVQLMSEMAALFENVQVPFATLPM